MTTIERRPGVRCSACLLPRVEDQVARTLLMLSRATAAQRPSLARMLLSAAEELRGCARRDSADPECCRCARFAEQRRRTAVRLLRAGAIDESLQSMGIGGALGRRPTGIPARLSR